MEREFKEIVGVLKEAKRRKHIEDFAVTRAIQIIGEAVKKIPAPVKKHKTYFREDQRRFLGKPAKPVKN